MRHVRLIGAPTDVNGSYLRGPAKAPLHIRRMLLSDMGNPASENGLELGTDIQLEIGEDLPLDQGGDDDELIAGAVAAAARSGQVPITLGGDHSITYPIVKALAAVHGPLSILHVDAHPDLYDELLGNRRSHASPFARIMEGGHATRLVQVGIRTLNRHQREQATRFGVEIVPMTGFDPAKVPIPPAPLYVSIDLDGLDPAYAPGVSHHEPGGLSTRQLLDLLARIEGPIVGADVVELNPDRDINDMTATVAAKLVKQLAAMATDG